MDYATVHYSFSKKTFLKVFTSFRQEAGALTLSKKTHISENDLTVFATGKDKISYVGSYQTSDN